MQPTNTNLKPAFELLANTVNDFYLRGRPCLGATLKPKLYERGFDEKLFDFRKFGDFLRAAENAGYVRLSKSSGGDIAIALTSAQSSTPPVAQPDLPFLPEPTTVPPAVISFSGPVQVRPDLWNAFNSNSDKWVYDPDNDRAFRADTEGWYAPARTLIPIPAAPNRIVQWMRAFTEQQEPGLKMMLTANLDRGIDGYQFTIITKNNGLQRPWRQFRIQRVLTAIETWAREHNLHPKNVAVPYHNPSITRTPPAPFLAFPSIPVVTPPAVVSPYLNTRLESIVDSLINDLITLRGLLAVAGPKQP